MVDTAQRVPDGIVSEDGEQAGDQIWAVEGRQDYPEGESKPVVDRKQPQVQ